MEKDAKERILQFQASSPDSYFYVYRCSLQLVTRDAKSGRYWRCISAIFLAGANFFGQKCISAIFITFYISGIEQHCRASVKPLFFSLRGKRSVPAEMPLGSRNNQAGNLVTESVTKTTFTETTVMISSRDHEVFNCWSFILLPLHWISDSNIFPN